MSAQRWGRRAALAACCIGLSGCVVAPVGYYDGYAYSGGGEVVSSVAPPAPYYEVVPVAPYVGAVWFGGYWNWYGGRYAWVPGYWGHGRPGYGWHPYHWAPHGGGWARSGGWYRR
ncbi:MAG TPA: hypothetical protein VFZ28_02585 [Burkholderiaceae bacterium]|nr:hypothetical protein [Burkholderiaceae bacterium]